MAESRADLLNWLNQLLQLGITKIESLGTAAAYCQVIDSIYGDIPIHRVKFNANTEYQYVANFKILQDAFRRHSIDKPIPVEGLVRCKMQDNLEFTQWLKKFWDANWSGEEYDAIGRRGGQGGAPRGVTPSGPSSSRTTAAARAPVAAKRAPVASTSTAASSTARRPLNNSGGGGVGGVARAGSAQARVNEEALQALTAQMGEMKVSVEALEKERDFYFNKLRDIEIIVGARMEEPDDTTEQEILKRIQEILYQTEEGFEVPEEENGLVDEEETF